MVLITLIVALTIVTGMFLWAAVKIKIVQLEGEIMKEIHEYETEINEYE